MKIWKKWWILIEKQTTKLVGVYNLITLLGAVIFFIVFIKTLDPLHWIWYLLQMCLEVSNSNVRLYENHDCGFSNNPFLTYKNSKFSWIYFIIRHCFLIYIYHFAWFYVLYKLKVYSYIKKNILNMEYFVVLFEGISLSILFVVYAHMYQSSLSVIYHGLQNKSKSRMRKVFIIVSI